MKDYKLSLIRLIATILIINCHLLEYIGFNLNYGQVIGIVGNYMAVGVPIFFILSGYLYGNKKLEIKRIDFIVRNEKKILLKYYIYFFVFVIPIYILFAPQVITIKSLIGMLTISHYINGIHHFWFIPYIVLCYFMTPYLYELKEEINNNNYKVFYILVFMMILEISTIVFNTYFTGIWLNCYFFAFFFSSAIKRLTIKKIFILTIIVLLLNIGSYYIRYIFRLQMHSKLIEVFIEYYINIARALLGFNIFIVILCNDKLNFKNKNLIKILEFSDRYSYDIYITHMIYIKGILSLLSITKNIFINILITVVIIILSSIVLNKSTNWIEELIKKIESKYLLKFLIIGIISTIIDFIIYLFIFKIIEGVFLSKLFSFICACLCSFYFNKNWTFNIVRNERRYFFKYFQVQLINLGINVTVNFILYFILKNKIIPFIVATLIATMANFFLQKFYVFNCEE